MNSRISAEVDRTRPDDDAALSSSSSGAASFSISLWAASRSHTSHSMWIEKLWQKFLICSLYAKSGSVDYTNLLLSRRGKSSRSHELWFFPPSFYSIVMFCEYKNQSPWRITDGKKVTIHVAFMKCHSDPKRSLGGSGAGDINQTFWIFFTES